MSKMILNPEVVSSKAMKYVIENNDCPHVKEWENGNCPISGCDKCELMGKHYIDKLGVIVILDLDIPKEYKDCFIPIFNEK